ncbi:MAG: isoaspartyl peptidase/L-asparaginase family protein, partial [Myxococcota bacterium]
MVWTMVVHGGAGDLSAHLPEEEQRRLRDGLALAVKRGSDVLATGGTALDAVSTAVRCLEDNPLFNAGVGAVCNEDGTCELDASIMSGVDRSCGAVGALRRVKNPIVVARAVMEKTPHVLLVGEGGDRFALAQGVPPVEPASLLTERRRTQWERVRHADATALSRSEDTQGGGIDDDKSDLRGTVGAVALDSHGHLAAATSTGGLCNKRAGRVGDSGVIGAGTWASDETCAVSTTGSGELFQRHLAAHTVHA